MALSARISIAVLVLTSGVIFGLAAIGDVFGESLTQSGVARVAVDDVEVAATTNNIIIPIEVNASCISKCLDVECDISSLPRFS